MSDAREKLEAVQTAAQIGKSRGGMDLTEWEERFIESIENQLNDERSLSEKQQEILDRLWDKS